MEGLVGALLIALAVAVVIIAAQRPRPRAAAAIGASGASAASGANGAARSAGVVADVAARLDALAPSEAGDGTSARTGPRLERRSEDPSASARPPAALPTRRRGARAAIARRGDGPTEGEPGPGDRRTGTGGDQGGRRDTGDRDRPGSTQDGPDAGPDGDRDAAQARERWESTRREHSRAGKVFGYGAALGPQGYHHDGTYACLAVVTTGYAAMRDRLVEVAVVRADADGRVLDEWTTLLDPVSDAAVPAVFLHGVAAGLLPGAPTFSDVASEILSRLECAVVVMHNAPLVESFLAAEFVRAGVVPPAMPALSLANAAPQTLPVPNARLATLASYVSRSRPLPATAQDEARLVAAVLPVVLRGYDGRLAYPIDPLPATAACTRRTPRVQARPALTSTGAGGAQAGWLADLMTRLPMSAAEMNDPRLAAYLDALAAVLPSGRIVAEECRELAGLLARSGYRADQIRATVERLLESMRQAAFAQGRLGDAHVRHLRAAALSVGVPAYFDDLIAPPTPPAPVPGSGTFSRPVRKPLPPAPPAQAPRCGHCLTVGHYTAACPRLRGRSRVSPIGEVPGFGPIDPVSPI